GMYWEELRYAEDYELSFRLADNAAKSIFRSAVVGEVDVSEHPSVVRSYQAEERLLFGILACTRAELRARDPGLRRTARSGRAWCNLDLAERALETGRSKEAREFAFQALMLHPSLRGMRVAGKALALPRRQRD